MPFSWEHILSAYYCSFQEHLYAYKKIQIIHLINLQTGLSYIRWPIPNLQNKRKIHIPPPKKKHFGNRKVFKVHDDATPKILPSVVQH